MPRETVRVQLQYQLVALSEDLSANVGFVESLLPPGKARISKSV
jgi:hypothetical protein